MVFVVRIVLKVSMVYMVAGVHVVYGAWCLCCLKLQDAKDAKDVMVPEIQYQGQTCSVKLCFQGSVHRAPQPWIGSCVVCQQKYCAESQQHRNSTNRPCL